MPPPQSKTQHFGNALLLIAAVGALLTVAGTSLRSTNLACVSNAASVSLAVSQYVQDNDGIFPPMNSTAAFEAAVQPYTQSHSEFVCPVTGVDYKPNPALSHASLSSLGQDPGSAEVIRDGQPHSDGISTVGFVDGHIERRGVEADPEQASLSNAKQLALAVEQYTQDYDETLPPLHTPAEMQAAIFPYVRTTRIFRSPVTGLLYTPNPSLSGQLIDSYPNPSATELFRDPRRHRDGKLVVAYLDGHVVRQ